MSEQTVESSVVIGAKPAPAIDTSAASPSPTDKTPAASAPADSDTGKKKDNRVPQERVDEITREKHAEKRRADEAEAQLVEARKILAEKQAKEDAAKVAAADPKPTKADFGDPDEYASAVEAWADRQVQRADEAQTKRAREAEFQQARVKQVENWKSVRAEAIKEIPDYIDVAESDLALSQNLAILVTMHPRGPYLAYYLGKNPEEVKRLGAMSAEQAAFAIGELSPKIASVKSLTSSAPAPIVPVRGSGGGSTKTLEEMSAAEHYAAIEARNAANKGKGARQ